MRLAAAAASPIGDGMFDLAWSEIALIAVVAVVVIGPKDLPDAVRGVARMVRKGRQMLAEMQTQADELVREANLHEVRESINEIRNFNLKDAVERAVDDDGSIRKTFSEDPLRDWSHEASPTVAGAEPPPEAPPAEEPPAFIPPGTHLAAPPPAAEPLPPAPPAFVPPSAAAPGASTHNA